VEEKKGAGESGENPARASLRTRYEPNAGTPDYHLIVALKTGALRSGKRASEVLLDACRAFWLPIACHRSGEYTGTELVQIGMTALRMLREQEEYIREVLALGGGERVDIETGDGTFFDVSGEVGGGFDEEGVL
jgi:hypothetical protein